MKFNLLKNGKNATAVFANAETKEIYPAHRNSFGYNAIQVIGDWFYHKYGKNMKTNQGKSNSSLFSYSKNDMMKVGFKLVERGEKPLF